MFGGTGFLYPNLTVSTLLEDIGKMELAIRGGMCCVSKVQGRVVQKVVFNIFFSKLKLFSSGGLNFQTSCPEDYMLFRGVCYATKNAKKSWHESKEACKLDGANLVSCFDKMGAAFLAAHGDVGDDPWLGQILRWL